jgi:hypothetical protein
MEVLNVLFLVLWNMTFWMYYVVLYYWMFCLLKYGYNIKIVLYIIIWDTALTARTQLPYHTYLLYILHVCTYSHRPGVVRQVGDYRVFGRRVYRTPGRFNRIPTAICNRTLLLITYILFSFVPVGLYSCYLSDFTLSCFI